MNDPLSLDAEKLESWLKDNLQGFIGPSTVTRLLGGQSNPTYLLHTKRKKYVLRRKPPGKLLPSAHAIEREYRVISALAESQVPVPNAYLLCEDEAIIGTAFYIMEYVDGRIFYDPRLPELKSHERSAIYDEMNRVIALLHKIDYSGIGLGDFGREGGYVERQIARWTRQYRASETETIDAMERLIEWAPNHLPRDDETTLVHGDYRIDNLVFHPSQTRIIGVLDWEIATLGHPLADFAYHVMIWRLSQKEFRGLSDANLASLGIPNEIDYVNQYARRTNREHIPDWGFYIAYNMFRMAAILQGILGRVRDGTASSEDGEGMGALVKPVAEAAWRQVEQIGAI